MNTSENPLRTDAIVIGGGQAGLSVSYHLAKRGVEHVVLDASPRIGDAWRNRWDSLRLFTPARYDALDGLRFPAANGDWPTKDAMADYLQTYAEEFQLPVLSDTRVDGLSREHDGYVVHAGDRIFHAPQVVVAVSNYQIPRIPIFATELGSDIRQLSAGTYRNPAQLAPGGVLIVGAGNSGAEIAKDVVGTHPVILAGTISGEIPFAATSFFNRHILVHILNGIVFNRILSIDSPLGRRAGPKMMTHGVPLIRVRSKDLAALGVRRAGRMVGVDKGWPLLVDGSVLAVQNVIWCTGFSPGFSWIDVPVIGNDGEPEHDRGVVATEPGLYFVGLHFLTSLSSAMIHGVGKDAERIAARVSSAVSEKPRTVASI
ncbi:MAG: FAD-dependent oxidoreductase [Leifsonia sp.]